MKTAFLVMRINTMGWVGSTWCDLRDSDTGALGAVFAYATREQAEEAADGCAIIEVGIGAKP